MLLFLMNRRNFSLNFFIIVVLLLASTPLLLHSSFAQYNQTGNMITLARSNETDVGNQSQQADLEQLNEVVNRIFGGGNQSQ